MVRVYTELVRQLHDLLFYVQAHYPGIESDLNRRFKENAHQEWQPESITDLLSLLQKLFESKNVDKSLIDVVVEILHLPFAVSMSPATLSELREAILFPDELDTLKKTLKKQERVCRKCGDKLYPGQLTVLALEGGLVTLWCTACTIPRLVSTGERVVQVDSGLLRKLRNIVVKKDLKSDPEPVKRDPDELRVAYERNVEGIGVPAVAAPEPQLPRAVWENWRNPHLYWVPAPAPDDPRRPPRGLNEAVGDGRDDRREE